MSRLKIRLREKIWRGCSEMFLVNLMKLWTTWPSLVPRQQQLIPASNLWSLRYFSPQKLLINTSILHHFYIWWIPILYLGSSSLTFEKTALDIQSSVEPAKIVSVYDPEIPQSQTADKPVASWGRATQQSRDTRKTNKAKQPALSSPSRWLQN